MAKQAEAGKGSKPRKAQDNDAYSDGYDRIFGSKKRKETESTEVNVESHTESTESNPTWK